MNHASREIIFFDGVCGLCNRFVDFVIKRDKSHRYFFSPLQGEAAKEHGLTPTGDASAWSIALVRDGRIYEKSTAALKIFSGLGRGWKLLGAFLILPVFLRDAVYEWIARNRYNWFGKKGLCRLPQPHEKPYFLP